MNQLITFYNVYPNNMVSSMDSQALGANESKKKAAVRPPMVLYEKIGMRL